jgi:Uma2 family endonuclease
MEDRMSVPSVNTEAGNFAELLARLGGIPLERIRTLPAPGTATETDVVAARLAPERRLCELIDGVLVEKAVGARESLLAAVLIQLLFNHVEAHDLGIVLGADGALRLFPGQVRIPDVSFLSWHRLPGRALPDEAVPELAPDLAVEVISAGNTPAEMKRKVRDYFKGGARLVWLIHPPTRSADVHPAGGRRRRLQKNQSLEGGDVLPGLTIPLPTLFARAGLRE